MANTIADKLQGLIDGKQYVVDKVNSKTGSNFTINSKWKDIGDTVETYEGGGASKSLKPYLDIKKNATNLFSGLRTMTNEQLAEFLPTYDTTENVTNMTNMVYNCTALETIPPLDTSKVTSMNSTFNSCSSLTTIPLLDTSSCTDMNDMFRGCVQLTEVPLLDTSKVTSMNSTFNSCSSLTTIPPLNTSKVTSMSSMFYRSNIKEIPQLDTSQVTTMSNMFYYCNNLKTIPQLDTSACTDINNMFNYCKSLTEIPLSDTSKITNMSSAFYECSGLTKTPQLNTSSVTNFNSTFNQCTNLTKVDISHFNISSSSYSSYMCYKCCRLKAIIIRSFGSKYALNSNSLTYSYHFTGEKNASYNPNGDKDGYFYIPREYIEILSSATNWSAHASQFRALEDYTKDGTTTGEFDDEKAGLL